MKIMHAELTNVRILGHFHVEYITFNFSYSDTITIICYSHYLYPPLMQLLYYDLYCY